MSLEKSLPDFVWSSASFVFQFNVLRELFSRVSRFPIVFIIIFFIGDWIVRERRWLCGN